MNKDVENNLKSIFPADSDMNNFFQMLELPDEKFDQIYPRLKDISTEIFKSAEFQSDIIRNAKIYNQLNDVDLEAEKAAIQELINDIKDDDSISDKKKEILIGILEASTLATYDLLEVPRERIEVKIQLINPNAKLPTYAHTTDAGADVYAAESVWFMPGETKIVPTGLKVAIPTGYEIQIRPRSGMSLKTGFRIANAPGTIDSDYRGEVGVIMTNTSTSTENIAQGDKIAQMVISPVPMIKWIETDNLDETERGESGFGSTDKS